MTWPFGDLRPLSYELIMVNWGDESFKFDEKGEAA